MTKFQPGNEFGKAGRPKGSRNKLDSHAYAVALAHVKFKRGDPAPAEYAQTSLWIALDTTLKTQPRDYVRAIISMLPKQGEVADGWWLVRDGVLLVEDLHGRLLGRQALQPGDNAEQIARRILRDKSGGGSDFYKRLQYPPNSLH